MSTHFINHTTELTVSVVSDGTTTTAQVHRTGLFGSKSVLAEGKARRRKGDNRNPELGAALAVSRAFGQLYKKESENAHRVSKDVFGE